MKPRHFALPALAGLLLGIPFDSARAAEVRGKVVPVRKSAARGAPAEHFALPFIADDYPRALALARQRKVPIFVESWAPW